jgi:hypothetical protein
MAMASNPNRNNRELDGSQSSRPSTRRVDPAHGPSNVPVLFRLKNLQRSEAAASPQSERAAHGTSAEPYVARPAVTSSSNSTSGTSLASTSHTEAPASSAGSNKPSSSDPLKTPGKHGVSNGFILLAVLVAVAFAIGRNSNKSQQVASTTPAPQASSASIPSSTPSVNPSTAPIAPLAPPALPVVASDAAVTSPKDDVATNEASLDLENSFKESAIESDSLAVPSMLVTAQKESTPPDETLTIGNDSPESTSNDNLATSTDLSEASDVSSFTIGTESIESSSKTTTPTLPTFGKSKSNATLVTTETSRENQTTVPATASKLVTTSIPEMDTAQLYEMRANFQSQMEALAKARQSQAQQNVASAVQSTTPQPTAAQPTMNVAPPVQGYGQPQPNYASVGQQPMTNSPNPPYTQYAPVSPSAPATQYQPVAQQVPANPYAATARQVSYPSNVQPNQQTPAQAYQPLFATPVYPVQGYSQPTMQPQGTASPYPNSAPPFQSN